MYMLGDRIAVIFQKNNREFEFVTAGTKNCMKVPSVFQMKIISEKNRPLSGESGL